MSKDDFKKLYLGSAYRIGSSQQFFINLKPQKLEELQKDNQADEYGKVKIRIVEFLKRGQKPSHSIYLHTINNPINTVQLLQVDLKKMLANPRGLDNRGEEVVKLTSSPTKNTNPGNHQNLIVYANKYTPEMENLSVAEKKEALSYDANEIFGGGWEWNKWVGAQKSSKPLPSAEKAKGTSVEQEPTATAKGKSI